MRSKELFIHISEKLKTVESKEEANSITYIILDELFHSSRTDVLIDKEVPDYKNKADGLDQIIERLLNKEPVQHILGHTEFYGRKFLVNKNVLIPRPETEELIHLIITADKSLKEGKIVDIGTGSGIIPITLKKELPENNVLGIDISHAALATAKRNAQLNNVEVEFIEDDILNSESDYLAHSDIIVSNPPYVTNSERKTMDTKVLEHDPALALFVEDDDPLLFYRVIAEKAYDKLNVGGKLYFEINEQFGDEVVQLLTKYKYKNITLIKDMQGKNRFTSAIK
ncbi:peptide chain release factor N(5)-glutamine methyltransferase [Marivirga atlantica]|jgi:release factor glutamine methyltransferase|uniref:peptide chain release factor N(5)-glutamine methyltransferase n=1 Tax=Marivirga atlantica TaxID=1548457 RepID=A0A937DI26_9BACT|nr:peptide chain release factor N(5)-glutamine methyltransferase [Marivirga atlantica]MBL0766548.1 peptide chain release factor N(5)-glutamine methyltransferase [Marivirga atlantica]